MILVVISSWHVFLFEGAEVRRLTYKAIRSPDKEYFSFDF